MLTKTLKKVGNSHGFILSKDILSLIGASPSTVFEVKVDSETQTVSYRALSQEEADQFVLETANQVSKDQSEVLKKLAE